MKIPSDETDRGLFPYQVGSMAVPPFSLDPISPRMIKHLEILSLLGSPTTLSLEQGRRLVALRCLPFGRFAFFKRIEFWWIASLLRCREDIF